MFDPVNPEPEKPAQLVEPQADFRRCSNCDLGLPPGRFHFGLKACVDDLKGVVNFLAVEKRRISADLLGAERMVWLLVKLRGGRVEIAPELLKASPEAPKVAIRSRLDQGLDLEALPDGGTA